MTTRLVTATGVAFIPIAMLGSGSSAAHEKTLAAFVEGKHSEPARVLARAETSPAEKRVSGTCRLSIELIDAETKRILPGLVRVTDSESNEPLALLELIWRPNDWYAMPGRSVVSVPQTQLVIEALHGLGTRLTRQTIDLGGRNEAVVRLRLTRFYRAAEHKLRSANTHLHLNRMSREQADRYLQVVSKADGLDLVYVSYLQRPQQDRTYVTNGYTADDLARLSDEHIVFRRGQEQRHNFGAFGEGYGHVLFLDIKRLIHPVSIGPGIMKTGSDGVPLRRGIDAARRDGASVIWCHNRMGMEGIPSWVSGVLDAQNIFDGAEHGSYEHSFYRYLNLGFKVPFSTGTDWFISDFSRVLVPVEGTLTSPKWLQQLAAGRSYITNGTFLELDVAGHRVGDTIRVSGPTVLAVRGRGIGRNDFRALELVHNGEVVHSIKGRPEAGRFEADMEFPLRLEQPGWVALRIALESGENEFGAPLFAHTSPIYVEVAGDRIFRPRVAQRLISEIRRSMAIIETRGTFFGAEERQAVLRVYRDGIESLRKRLNLGE